MYQDALTRLHPKRLPGAQHLVVNRIKRSAYFKSVRTHIESWPIRSGFGSPSDQAPSRPASTVDRKYCYSRSARNTSLVIASGVVRSIDHEKTELPRVRTAMKIHHRRGVRVIPSRPRRLGHELIPPPPVRRDRGSAFFLRPIDLRRDQQAVPMHKLRNVCAVHHVNGDGLAFAHSQQGPGNLIVVADGADYNLRSQLDQHGRDLQGEIRPMPHRPRSGGLRLQRRHPMLRRPRSLRPKPGLQPACPGRHHGAPSKPYKIPSLHAILIPASNEIRSRPIARSCNCARPLVRRRGLRSQPSVPASYQTDENSMFILGSSCDQRIFC